MSAGADQSQSLANLKAEPAAAARPDASAAQWITIWEEQGATQLTLGAPLPCGHTFADGITSVGDGAITIVLMSCCACGRLYWGESTTPVTSLSMTTVIAAPQ